MATNVTKKARLALYALFLIPGLTLATWVTRTPALRDGLEASTEQMGMILFGFSLGAMAGVISSGRLVTRLGANRVILIGLLALSVGLCVMASSLVFNNSLFAFSGLLIFGAGLGLAEIAANIEGAAVERTIQKPIMTTMHGCFSLGTLIGSIVGLGMTKAEVSLGAHLAFIALVSAAVSAVFIGHATRESEKKSGTESSQSPTTGGILYLLKDKGLLLICFIVLAMALAEGAANDWLPLLMIDGHGFAETTGTLIYVVFTVGMTVGRFGGSYLVERIGRVSTLRISAMVGALSLALVVFCDIQWVAAVAVAMWGLGASLGFPLAISAAGESGNNSDQRVKLAATAGYLAFLVGPPLLGFIGETFGLRIAMLPVLLLVAIAFIIASSLQNDAKREPQTA
ncbi:MFS transporter [Pseudomonas fulva]|uniref:MFS transporter n=1 Tax=Pseudomonas fulva TaxID=47880 RepID=UPI00201D8547|nr:MFS transporter [Pseudomonas fulva]UQY33046.1 MFS transporter [Pseudomonas fulva]